MKYTVVLQEREHLDNVIIDYVEASSTAEAFECAARQTYDASHTGWEPQDFYEGPFILNDYVLTAVFEEHVCNLLSSMEIQQHG